VEEFSGPFKSWADAKTRFGATGNGKTDDTRKLQTALDSLSNTITSFNVGNKGYMVLYLPAGTYRITQTLVLRGKIGVSIIGEDPANTIIKWDGADNDTMLWANGSAYFKIARFTWDANQKKGVEAIGVHWTNRWDDGKSKSNAPLNIELSDHVFTGGFAVGIGGETFSGYGTGNNDSEVTIKRCTFNGCSDAGIKITGFNALDYWIWHCRFIKCYIGVYTKNGNYHAYRSYFEGNHCDLYNNQGYYTSVRECYSIGADAFSYDEGISCNPFKRIFQNNTVINYKQLPLMYYHLGAVSLINNVFSSTTKNIPYVVDLGSWCPGIYSVLSVNNRYSSSKPIKLDKPVMKIVRIDDALPGKNLTAAPAFEQSLPKPARRTQRKVFEVPVNATAAEIQRIINQAASLKGTKPVVHLPYGLFYLDKTIIIPAGADLQLVGDGLLYASRVLFRDNVTTANPVFRILGPSYITIRDLQIGTHTGNNANNYKALVFENIDQPGAGLVLDQLHSSSNNSLYLNGLNYLQVEKNNSFFSEGNYVSGGNIQKSGKGTFRVTCFGGQYARLTVRNNADFVAKDCWWEGPTRIPLDLKGDGNITIDGAKIAPHNVDSMPTIAINQFNGRISLMNMYIQGGLFVNPDNNQLKVLGWNLHFYHKMMPLSFINKKSNYKGLFMGIHSQCFDDKNPDCKSIRSHEAKEVNITDVNSFIKDMISQTSQRLTSSAPAPKKGASDIHIYRLSVGSFNTAIEVVNK
jgi:hypothetical protein